MSYCVLSVIFLSSIAGTQSFFNQAFNYGPPNIQLSRPKKSILPFSEEYQNTIPIPPFHLPFVNNRIETSPPIIQENIPFMYNRLKQQIIPSNSYLTKRNDNETADGFIVYPYNHPYPQDTKVESGRTIYMPVPFVKTRRQVESKQPLNVRIRRQMNIPHYPPVYPQLKNDLPTAPPLNPNIQEIRNLIRTETYRIVQEVLKDSPSNKPKGIIIQNNSQPYTRRFITNFGNQQRSAQNTPPTSNQCQESTIKETTRRQESKNVIPVMGKADEKKIHDKPGNTAPMGTKCRRSSKSPKYPLNISPYTVLAPLVRLHQTKRSDDGCSYITPQRRNNDETTPASKEDVKKPEDVNTVAEVEISMKNEEPSSRRNAQTTHQFLENTRRSGSKIEPEKRNEKVNTSEPPPKETTQSTRRFSNLNHQRAEVEELMDSLQRILTTYRRMHSGQRRGGVRNLSLPTQTLVTAVQSVRRQNEDEVDKSESASEEVKEDSSEKTTTEETDTRRNSHNPTPAVNSIQEPIVATESSKTRRNLNYKIV